QVFLGGAQFEEVAAEPLYLSRALGDFASIAHGQAGAQLAKALEFNAHVRKLAADVAGKEQFGHFQPDAADADIDGGKFHDLVFVDDEAGRALRHRQHQAEELAALQAHIFLRQRHGKGGAAALRGGLRTAAEELVAHAARHGNEEVAIALQETLVGFLAAAPVEVEQPGLFIHVQQDGQQGVIAFVEGDADLILVVDQLAQVENDLPPEGDGVGVDALVDGQAHGAVLRKLFTLLFIVSARAGVMQSNKARLGKEFSQVIWRLANWRVANIPLSRSSWGGISPSSISHICLYPTLRMEGRSARSWYLARKARVSSTRPCASIRSKRSAMRSCSQARSVGISAMLRRR